MRQNCPLLLPAGVELQFEIPSSLVALRLHGNARLIPLAPSTSVQFVGTEPSPYSTLSRAHSNLPYYRLLVAAAVVVPSPSSRGLPGARGQARSVSLWSSHHDR